jgi:hypothetical protein
VFTNIAVNDGEELQWATVTLETLSNVVFPDFA